MEEGKNTPYTEAELRLRRIHQILTMVNECNINLLSYDENSGQFKYQIKFNLLNTLYAEINSKTNEGERNSLQKFRGFIYKILNENPPHTTKREIHYPHKNSLKFNPNNFSIIQEVLFNYEISLRDLIDKYYPDPKDRVYED